MDDSVERLATYGTLAPGRQNNHVLNGLNGSWRKGVVKGSLEQDGWGAELGYPGLVLDPAGDAIEVDVFESADLPAYWDRLDRFEGDGYRRVVVSVNTRDGDIDAYIYVLST